MISHGDDEREAPDAPAGPHIPDSPLLQGGEAGGPSISSPRAEQEPEAPVVFDPDEALRRCFDEPAMVQELVRLLFDEADQLLGEMKEAAARGDTAALGRAAHRLKGTVVYLGARPLADATRRAEQIGTSGDAGNAPDAVDALEVELMRLMDALLELRRRPA